MDVYDAIVIGGGPGGSATATLLAKKGRRVLVLEKERFPRFHIGESLLPYNQAIFEEMGVLEKLRHKNFPRKLGAQFHIGNSSKALKLVFSNGKYTRHTTAFQVERSVFDEILLRHANDCGAEVLEGCAVTGYSVSNNKVTVQTRVPGGSQEFSGSFLVDASGRANFTGNKEGLRIIHPDLKKMAIFGHFENVVVDEGTASGDTVIVRLEDKWFWIIPLGAKVSVGCVLDQEEVSRAKVSPKDLFEQLVESSTEMRHRMSRATPVNDISVTSDFSYFNRRLTGDRLVRVGDAAGFMDPIFSAGVYIAMHSGRLAAEVIDSALRANNEGSALFSAYEKQVFHAMRYFWVMVEKFYTKPFMELFMEPRPKFHLPDAVVAILAGELDGGWKLEWRRKLFFGLIRMQSRMPLVPRLSFEEPAKSDPCSR